MPLREPYWNLALALGLFVCGGCSEELGPERFETTRVSGRLAAGGQPVGRGWVEFLPIGGTVGKPRSAPLGTDGRFSIDGVAVGWNRIGVVGAPLAPGVSGMFHPFTSPIRRRITSAAPSFELDLDLATEARRLRPKPVSNRREPSA